MEIADGSDGILRRLMLRIYISSLHACSQAVIYSRPRPLCSFALSKTNRTFRKKHHSLVNTLCLLGSLLEIFSIRLGIRSRVNPPSLSLPEKKEEKKNPEGKPRNSESHGCGIRFRTLVSQGAN